MNQIQRFVLLFAFFSSLLCIYFGILFEIFLFYAIGSIIFLVFIVQLFRSISSNKTSLILILTIFLLFRYIPIMKYNQPLYSDSIADLATAKEFERNEKLSILNYTDFQDMQMYSGWPLLHVLIISIHHTTGLSLSNIFTYYPPIMSIVNLLFIYLISNLLFREYKISGVTALIYATFSINMFWETQYVRQSLAFTLGLLAIYLYLTGRNQRKVKIVALSLLAFCSLPIAHHLTSLEIPLILLIAYSLSLFSPHLFRKTLVNARMRTIKSDPFTVVLILLTSAFIFGWWLIYPQDMIFRVFTERLLRLQFIGQNPSAVPEIIAKTQRTTDLYDALTYLRLLLLVCSAFIGALMTIREKHPYTTFLFAHVAAPLSLLSFTFLIDKAFELRHLLFLVFPMAILAAKALHKLDRKCLLSIFLLVIILPTPFKLMKTFELAPTHIFQKSSKQSLVKGETFVYREEPVLRVASHFAIVTDHYLIADYYTASALSLLYDIHKVYIIRRESFLPGKPTFIEPIFILNIDYYRQRIELYEGYPLAEYVTGALNGSILVNRIYDNSEVVAWSARARAI